MSDSTESEKPRISDAEMLARFQNSKKRPPCSDTLGMRLTAVDQDQKRIRMDFDVSPNFANPTGAIQGGFIAAMMDEAMSTCCIIASNVTMTAPTLEMKTSFLAPLPLGKCRARGQAVRVGRNVGFMEGTVWTGDGEIAAKATATCQVRRSSRIRVPEA